MARDTKHEKAAKKPYMAPTLTTYGSVKEMTGGNSGTSAGDAGNMMFMASDPVLKDNVARIGEHPAGFGFYLFDYKAEFKRFGEGRQFGVMADEVERIVPEAVTVDEDGFRKVNYAMLGITRH